MQARKLGKIKSQGIYQSGGPLGNFFGQTGITDPSSYFKSYGQAGDAYKGIFGDVQSSGMFATRAPLPEWGDQTAEQYRQKVISNMKLKKVGDKYETPDGQSLTYDEITDLAGKLYDQTKETNKSFNEGAPMAAQMAGLLDLGRREQDELKNKKETIQNYPVVKSSFAPSGFAEQGGYNNLVSLFVNGGQQAMGYKDNSPYRNMPSQEFYTDTLTMDGVSRPIMAVPNVGKPVVMAPNGGNYYFPGASQITEVPMAREGGNMYKEDIDHAKFGDFFKKVGNVVSDYGRGMADSFGNMTGLYDIGNEGYKTKFGRKIAGSVDKYSRGIGKVVDLAATTLGGPLGGAIVGTKNAAGKMINPQGLGAAQEQRNAERADMLSSLDPTGRNKGMAGLSSLLGGSGGAGGLGALGGLLGGAGGGLGGLLGGAGGAGGMLGGLLGGGLPFGEQGGRASYSNLVNLFQEGGEPQMQMTEEEMAAMGGIQEGNKFMELPKEQQIEVYKSLIDFILENGIDALEEQYPEEYEFFDIFNDFIEEAGREDNEENDDQEEDDNEEEGSTVQGMANGGIPQRYKNLGFTKVGQKRQSTRPGKKWMVLAKKGDQYKVVHGGAKGMSDFTKHKNLKRRKRFWDRMGGTNSSKATDPFSPLYWHKRFGTW
jgi:hypothetical protein